ncbi:MULTISPECIES: UDP-N-acetylmuramoyl-L-alanine--D-glutamate ligase [unclassified Corynebacterium]|uniref:UDP-N-acetylmuramoyl-L-alanine--D-glutamate ligase n=1 Tax=unclassified Corynebacterium TaxID=2624378 RepID=UPI002169F0C2|nr:MULTISPECIES: UDP-N-acetylmuramoyl-L-alanine--D-glutamate ligase [unclassified Corynebacterium]MCS4490826.1 UDP-N-acetylmuramoyl-L-alanine--D-glutamate ligase [Corynebacterium sp. ES2715-CONJ3]MCS4531291.1 UDP-N-acetylmuramoyl-L-alanine--D-glutamate ligase [Corynebacterium sp. ES2730-CONJ]
MNITGPILVTGAGVSGTAMARLLSNQGHDVTLVDANETALAIALELTGVPGITPERAHHALADTALIVTSPGWRPDTPLFDAAAQRGVTVIGDVELCFRLDQAGFFGPPRTWMAVTGTNGKTTTTSMLAAMMRESGAKAQAVGNIGVSIAEALEASERVDIVVAELSSFQLHWAEDLRPHVGVLLNLAEDHLDWHGSMQAYCEDKAKILTAEHAIAGADDVASRPFISKATVTFTAEEPRKGQIGVRNSKICDRAFAEEEYIAPIAGIQPPGPAGLYDALAATAAARAVGVEPQAIARALKNFQSAGHRGQVIAYERGIQAIDNSKATNPHAADAALAGHDSILWVAGGQLKGADIDGLVKKYAAQLKAVALLGVDRETIARAVAHHRPDIEVYSIAEKDPVIAMDDAVAWLSDRACAGDSLILAPAAASLDMYTGMGQRGDIFSQAAKKYLAEHHQ